MTELLQLLSNVSGCNRTVSNACSADLSCDGESNAGEGVCLLLCSVLDGSELVSLLLEVFCKNFLSRLRCDNTLALWDEVVTAVARLYVDDVVLESQTYDIFFKYDFHISYLLF